MPLPDADLVSVVIPTRNRRDRLTAAIASVRRQTWPRIEIIVVDDGSIDGTSSRLEEMQRADPSLRIIRNVEPRGGGGARNQGIEAAAGRWIAFLDDDDTWLREKIEKQLVLLKAHPSASAVSCHYFYKARYRQRRVVRAVAGRSEQEMLSENSLGGASMCLTSVQTLRTIGGFDASLRSGQDWELWLRLFYAGPILVCEEPLVIYESHRGERITSDITSVYAGKRRIFFRYRQRMAPAARHSNMALLLYCRACAERASMRQRLASLRRICALVGIREGFKYSKWFTTTRLFPAR